MTALNKARKNMTNRCKSLGCVTPVVPPYDFCMCCLEKAANSDNNLSAQSMSERYPAYYKDVGDLTEVDVYAVHNLFQINDSSGCLHHASKKLLLSGARTGNKSAYQDIKEARDTLTRWLQINEKQSKAI